MKVETLTETARKPFEVVLIPVRLLYGIYAWLTFCLLGLITLAAVVLVPGLTRRRAITRRMAQFALTALGMRVSAKYMERIPQGQCVIVANHASYLDGVVFTAVLPPRFGFVIKREMADVPLAGTMLRRIGSHFVERFNHHKSASDARRVLRTATDGHSLVFFPEGTFSARPGLLKFHTGAFVTAAKAGCPVVPAVIRGTRHALPSSSSLPRPAQIEIEFLPPVTSAAQGTTDAAFELRDRSRAAILRSLHEPDLSSSHTAER